MVHRCRSFHSNFLRLLFTSVCGTIVPPIPSPAHPKKPFIYISTFPHLLHTTGMPIHFDKFTFCIKMQKQKHLILMQKIYGRAWMYFLCSITFKPPTSARWNGSNNGPRWVLWRGKGKQKKRKALKYPCCRQVLQSQELAPLQHTNREMFF